LPQFGSDKQVVHGIVWRDVGPGLKDGIGTEIRIPYTTLVTGEDQNRSPFYGIAKECAVGAVRKIGGGPAIVPFVELKDEWGWLMEQFT